MASTARLDELKKKFDENPRRYFAPLANEHRKSGDLDQAISLCRAHLPQQPAHISGHIVLGQALFEAAQLDESREIFQSALELDPENLIALRYLGDIARHSGDITTARSWYHRVLEFDPRNDEIVQLVRELDAPPATDASPEIAEHAAEDAQAPELESAPVAASDPANDARFAPLTVDEMDVDEDFLAVADSPADSPNHPATGAGDDATFDVHAAWTADSPTVEMPLLDAPELDPFDMPASASADSLFDGSADVATSDLFMSELSGDDFDDTSEFATPAQAESDSWPSASSADAAPSTDSDAEPSVQLSAGASDAASADAFEEGSFYADMPKSAGAEPEVEVPGIESLELPEHETVDAPTSEAQGDEPDREPITDLSAANDWIDVSDTLPAHAAETTAGAAAERPVDDGLGLEVMEFVPPPRSATESPEPATASGADPLVGHMPELSSADQGATPEAFVTETMAELYLQQGFRNEALSVYRELLARNPDDTSLRERIDQIESGSMSSISIATLSDNVVESAMRRQTARPTRSVRSFFASLAGRRAPYQAPPDADQPEATLDLPIEDERAAPSMMSEMSEMSEVSGAAAAGYGAVEASALEPAAQDANVPDGDAWETPAPDDAAPSTTAADVMASFDPFADNWGTSTDAVSPPSPNAELLEASESHGPSQPDLVEPAEPSVSPPTSPDAEPHRSAPRSLQDLFPESSAPPRADAAAAQTLATAFGRTEPQGRPTRAASNELSLDHVFRGAPEGAPAPDGGFSFDQFFSDSRSGGSDVAAAPAVSAPENGRNGEGADSHDIEQFTAWLEGLKKK